MPGNGGADSHTSHLALLYTNNFSRATESQMAFIYMLHLRSARNFYRATWRPFLENTTKMNVSEQKTGLFSARASLSGNKGGAGGFHPYPPLRLSSQGKEPSPLQSKAL